MRWPPWEKSGLTNPDARPARDPFLARPMIMPGVESGRDSHGLIQIRRQTEPRGKFTRSLSRIFKMNYAVRVNLDKAGSAFWTQIDGRRTLGEIAMALEKEFLWPAAQARHAAVEFTAMLMKRELIALQIDKAGAGRLVNAEHKI